MRDRDEQQRKGEKREQSVGGNGKGVGVRIGGPKVRQTRTQLLFQWRMSRRDGGGWPNLSNVHSFPLTLRMAGADGPLLMLAD